LKKKRAGLPVMWWAQKEKGFAPAIDESTNKE